MARYLLDFTRALRADEGSVRLPEGDVEYHVRGRAQSRPDLCALRWTPRLLERLDALRDRSGAGVGEEAARLGRQLADFLAVPGWSAPAAEIAARAREEATFLTIRSNAAELYLLPWELMPIGPLVHLGFLAKLLVRYEWPDTRTAPRLPGLSRAKRGRVVFAWSAAGGKVDAAGHVRLLERTTDAGRAFFEGDRGLDVVANASWRALQASLDRARAEGEPVAVLHLLCHGGCDEGGTFGLLLNDDRDPAASVLIGPSRMQQLLLDYAGLIRLVVISACDGGNAGPAGNELGSVAQALHRAGLPAVVASRFPLSWDGAGVFAEALYRALLVDLDSLEGALLAARRALRALDTCDWASLQLYAREADGDDTRVFNLVPYRGLAAFRPEHARFFFGRDAEVGELVGELDALVARGKARFMVVAGASGSGKSSMVMAGMVPRWARAAGELPRDHLVARVGADPAATLAQARAKRAAMPARAELLLVIDQFEELFTQVEDVAARGAFVRALWAWSKEPDAGVSVVATLRVDFLGRLGELVLDEAEGLRLDKVACDPAHQVLVAQMDAAQLREAIERPAVVAGLLLEANLAALIVHDVEAEPGALPLMSHALYLLWRGRDGDVLTRRAYEALGSVQGALNAHAQKEVDALADDAERATARRLLVRLVRPGADGGPDTRRRRAVAELRPEDGAERSRFDRVLRRLVDARLLVTGGGADGAQTVEVAHEALLRNWQGLKGWIDAERAKLIQFEQLEEWASEWRQRPDAVLAGSRLGYAEEVAARHWGDLGPEARRLIEASRAEARRSRWLRRGLGVGALAAVALVAAVVLSSLMRDVDCDKVPDVYDACRTQPIGPHADPGRIGCPADGDHDLVIDTADLCPTVAEGDYPDARRAGCPDHDDDDHDGVLNADDRCQSVPGSVQPNPDHPGCPMDRDGDLVADRDDRCPDEPGAPSTDPQRHGCPGRVRVQNGQLRILEPVYFAVDRDVILPRSEPVLDAVADALRESPGIRRVAIEVHTDDANTDEYNLDLSLRRANSMMNWLVQHGIAAERITARGFGETRPIRDVDGLRGDALVRARQENRRTEFRLLEVDATLHAMVVPPHPRRTHEPPPPPTPATGWCSVSPFNVDRIAPTDRPDASSARPRAR